MRRRKRMDDRALEALLRGGDAPDDLEDLAVFIRSGRNAATPGEPHSELGRLFADGLEVDASALRPEPARPPRRQRARRAVDALVARAAGAGLVAKIVLGSTVAVAGVTGAGAAGALPDPAQDAVARVVGVVSPFEFPTSADDRARFGERVSEDATDPGVRGPDVADDAREAHQQERPGAVSEDAGPPEGRPGPPEGVPGADVVEERAGPKDEPPAGPPDAAGEGPAVSEEPPGRIRAPGMPRRGGGQPGGP
jgi:hypothetical protein